MKDTLPDKFNWRTIRSDEAELVHALHRSVSAELVSGLLRPDDLDHFRRHTGAEGLTVGCFVDDVGIVAYGVLGIASDTACRMAEMLGIGAADRARFCILDGAASIAAWRGNGLHRELIRTRLEHANQAGRSLVGASVAPGNMTSMRGLLENGFHVCGFSVMYGGLARLIVKKDLRVAQPRWVLAHRVTATDVDAHRLALAEGLIGFSCSETGDGKWQVHYGYAAAHV
jgi:hypothetical protein